MRLAVIIGILASITFAILRLSWARGPEPIVVIREVHDDGSTEWSVLMPEQAMEHSQNVTADVIDRVFRAFDRRKMSARGCHVMGLAREGDGSIRFEGRCAWTDAPRAQRA